jgi:hypothetical protein
MSEESTNRAEPPKPADLPPVLSYTQLGPPRRPDEWRDVKESVGAGCAYIFVAILLSLGIASVGPGSSEAILIVFAILVGVPFIASLCVRGWRAFALGILIMMLLLIGAFSMIALLWKFP